MEPQKTNASTQTKVVVQKPRSAWRLKLALGLLTFLLIILLAAAGIGGVRGYMYYRDKNNEVAKLNSQVTELKSQQNLNIVDLQKQLDEVRQNNRNLDDENKQLRSDLNKANDRIAQLTPKDIRDLKIDSVIQINRAAGDAWQSPIYADINGDGKADGIYAYRLGGAGSFLNVYAYSYLDNTNPTQILKAEQYQKGEVSLQPDMTVDIKFQTGAPDSPETATAKFKWDSSAKKLVKI